MLKTMKKYVIILAVFSITVFIINHANAFGFSQSITLNPGWNIISTPRLVESHSFSVAENSDNFDIYILNPQDLSGWSTMTSLEFQPLFGYFINNKTEVNQTLTFNYKQNVNPSERLFTREFSKNGWYSIGIASPTYAKTQCCEINDTNNPANILFSIKQKISSAIDFTDGNSNISSVAVSSNWKGVNANDLDSLNDFRETKGYAVFINNTNNALYEGFQNNDPVAENTSDASSDASMDVTLAVSPASGENLYEAETGQAVYGIEVKASGSEIYVSRVRLQFNTAIYNIINKVGIYRDGSLLAEKVINSDAVTRITSTNYTIQLTGFESKVEKDTTATFVVKVNALSSIDSGYTSFTVLAPAGALRAVDGANIDVGDTSAALSANTVNVKQSGASAALLTISANASTPEETYVNADSTGKAEKVTLLVMNVKAEQDSVKLTDLTANVTMSGVGTSTIAFLYDGNTLVDSVALSTGAGTATFADFIFTVPNETTKQLTVKATFTGVTNATETIASSTITDNTLVVAEGPDGIALAAERKIVNALGNQVHLLKIVPVFTLTSAVATPTRIAYAGGPSSTAAASIKFSVKALGGDINVSSSNAITVAVYEDGAATSTAFTEIYSITNTTVSGANDVITQDQTATFEVAGTLSTSGWVAAQTGNYDFRITGFIWAPASAAAITTAFLDNLTANPFKTNIVYLP
jgi:hypothetical protein